MLATLMKDFIYLEINTLPLMGGWLSVRRTYQ